LPEILIAGNTKHMAEQSHLPAILLTRPRAQSLRFARQLRAAAGQNLQIYVAPLMQLEFRTPVLPAPAPAGLIFTSEAGVAAYRQLTTRPVAPVWCVGQKTAQAARSAGLETVFVAPDAATLLAHLRATPPVGQLLHLRGEDSHGHIAGHLTAANIPTAEAVIYAQRALPLAPHAQRLLDGGAPLVVPLFSARSARLFVSAVPRPHPWLSIAALSCAVAGEIPSDWPARIRVSPAPDGKAMLQTVLALLREPASA
jgi:uroporphyrinogen-III synthase